MIDYEKAILGKGENFRTEFAKLYPDHPELRFIDADIVARRARIAQLASPSTTEILATMKSDFRRGRPEKEVQLRAGEPVSLGDQIRLLRRLHNISMKELAFRLNVSHQHISSVERNHDIPSKRLLEAICDELSVLPEDLLIYEVNNTF